MKAMTWPRNVKLRAIVVEPEIIFPEFLPLAGAGRSVHAWSRALHFFAVQQTDRAFPKPQNCFTLKTHTPNTRCKGVRDQWRALRGSPGGYFRPGDGECPAAAAIGSDAG